MAALAVELRDLRHRYEDAEVLRGIDLTIGPGEVFGFLGHNGAGKTTAINILTTLLVPTLGHGAGRAASTSWPSAREVTRLHRLPAG